MRPGSRRPWRRWSWLFWHWATTIAWPIKTSICLPRTAIWASSQKYPDLPAIAAKALWYLGWISCDLESDNQQGIHWYQRLIALYPDEKLSFVVPAPWLTIRPADPDLKQHIAYPKTVLTWADIAHLEIIRHAASRDQAWQSFAAIKARAGEVFAATALKVLVERHGFDAKSERLAREYLAKPGADTILKNDLLLALSVYRRQTDSSGRAAMRLKHTLRKYRQSFHLRVFLALVLVIVIFIPGTGYVGYLQALKVAEDQMEQYTIGTAEQISKRVTSFLAQHTHNVNLLASLFAGGLIDSGNDRELLQYFHLFKKDHPEFVNIYFGDERGRFLMVPPQSPEVHKIFDPRNRPWYKGAVASHGINWTDVYLFASTQKPGITVSAPIYTENKYLRGVCGIDIDLVAFSKFLQGIDIGNQGVAYIFENRTGHIIAHPWLAGPPGESDRLDLLRASLAELTSSKRQLRPHLLWRRAVFHRLCPVSRQGLDGGGDAVDLRLSQENPGDQEDHHNARDHRDSAVEYPQLSAGQDHHQPAAPSAAGHRADHRRRSRIPGGHQGPGYRPRPGQIL